jgi:hypothetical protein
MDCVESGLTVDSAAAAEAAAVGAAFDPDLDFELDI